MNLMDDVPYEQLMEIAASVDERRGWDFSRMQTEREPVPWDYLEIVPRYLTFADAVLDIGTGGGEKFLAFAQYFEQGVGIDPDPDMIRAARENAASQPNVTFVEMGFEALSFPDATFDVVLNRHALLCVPEVVRVLKPGGYVVTQGVGAANMANIREAFGTGSGVRYADEYRAAIDSLLAHGCRIVVTGSYNVRYWVKDLPSLIFWFKAIAGANEVPEGFSVERDWQIVKRIVAEWTTPRGVLTNEHRTLLIAQKEHTDE
ncbi:MAG: class I SAM-dependent methyltransferase [Chloroflexota bacterium]|nr:class I SAM-dependent methyltransferase [Chloroflexota bacterium]